MSGAVLQEGARSTSTSAISTTAEVAPTTRRAFPIRVTFRFTHLLQLSVQFLVFCYWSLYWPDARDYFSRLAVLACTAYLVDALVSFARYRSWNLGVGPLPVVLSASLFVWFVGPTAWMAHVMVACGVASKHLLHRPGSGGRHLFNPSAFGVCVIAIPCILMPHRLGEIDVSHHLNTPPNMLEVILLLSSFAHWRVPVVLITASAALTATVLRPLMPLLFAAHPYTPAVAWAPIYLGITLLVTDPATTPRRPLAQLLFGASYMTLFAVIGSALETSGMNFWAKMLPIPLLNWFAPDFDQLAARMVEGWPRLSLSWLEPRFNHRHVIAWASFVVLSILAGDDKGAHFEANVPRPVRFVARQGDSRPTCDDNPVFCRPFSFAGEVRLWLASR